SFDAALLDEGDGVLKIVVSILRAVRRKDSPRKIWFAVDCFDYTHLVGADFDQRYRPAEESLGERVKKVQAGLEHVSLDADFAFGGHHASRRHAAAEITAFLNRNFARADVHKNSSQDYDQHNQRDNGDKQDRHYCHWIDVIHIEPLICVRSPTVREGLVWFVALANARASETRRFQFAAGVCEGLLQDKTCA